MLFIFNLIVSVVGIFILLTVISGVSLFLRVRRALRNPFDGQPQPGASPFRDGGNVIEGEYKVIKEEEK